MKRWLTAVLCLMMLTGCALAGETVRVHEMMLEGVSEEVTETLYQSGEGYEVWYPSEYLVPGEQYGHPCFYPVGADGESDIYFMIVPAQAEPADAEALLSEAVGGFGPEAQISEPEWTTTESGALLGSVQAVDGDMFYRYYLVTDEEELLLITACFPLEAVEGFGVRFDRLAETISFEQSPLTARYEGEDYAIFYPAELLQPGTRFDHDAFYPVEGGEASGVYLMIVKSDVAPEHADTLLDEADGGYEGYYAYTQGEEKTIENGLTLNWVQVEQEGRIDRYYLIKGEDSVYCLTASFPVMGETDYGALFDMMAESFELPVQE